MPTPLDKLKIPTHLDGRRKIIDEQKQAVHRLYHIEQQPIRRIAATTGVSRRSVQFILFPERLKAVQDRAKEVKRWENYNTKEYHTPAIQKNRAKKKLLREQGII